MEHKPQSSILQSNINTHLIEMEDDLFHSFLASYPPNEQSNIIDHLSYLRTYMLNFPEFDGEDYFISEEAYNHYRMRDSKLKETMLSEDEFLQFTIIQDSIKDLGLLPKPTFEMILYFWHILRNWLYHGKRERLSDKVDRMLKQIETHPEDQLSIDFQVGKKHFKFANSLYIRSIITYLNHSGIMAENLTETCYPNKREVDYILIRTLLQFLPIKHKKDKSGTFSQAERNFSLSVLWLTGELNHKKNDDPREYCTQYNNATFDKLMRDYKHIEIPALFHSL